MIEKRVEVSSDSSVDLIDEAKQILREHLVRLGLKQSAQRDIILRAFMAAPGHLSTEELHHLAQKHDPSIGYTTVYRTLKLFAQCGLAIEIELHDGVARYERGLHRRTHHHMICTSCGDSIEFFAPEIDEVERRIGEQFHFATSRHSFQIFGVCSACRQKSATRPA